MAKRILVPFDQGHYLEGVVALVAALAKSTGATVRLLHVSPIPAARVTQEHRLVATVDQEMERLRDRADDYQRMVEPQFAGVPIENVVRFGRRIPEILMEAEAFGADLIVLTMSPGRWFRRRLFGGAAAKVLRKAGVPVLVYGSTE